MPTMTRLRKPITRTHCGTIKDGGKELPITVTLSRPNLIIFRAKGRHQTYTLTTDVGYKLAVEAQVRDKERQKKREKQLKRDARQRRRKKC